MGQIRGGIMLKSSRFEVAVVVDPMEAGATLAASLGARHERALESALTNSANGPIDAVWISTGTQFHRDLIVTALSARKPTFCEKPVSESAAEIRECYALAESTGTPLVCGFQRRFDPHYARLLETVCERKAIGTVQTVHVVFRDHPCPPVEFLKTGGDPFNDLAPHDVDFVNLMLGEEPIEVLGRGSAFDPVLIEAGVMDPALMYLKYPGGALVTLEMSRNADYGYDQRIEVFGTKGMATVRSPPETTVEVADGSGFHTDVLEYSFPQRFAAAFANEAEAFADIVAGKRQPWVGAKECLAIHAICAAALTSAKTGELQRLGPAAAHAPAALRMLGGGVVGPRVGLRLLGAGSFGGYIATLLRKYPARHNFEVLPPFTRSSGLAWEADVLRDGKTEAVYICTPDAQHGPQAIACLGAGKAVLVEKPVLGWGAVRDAAQAAGARGWVHVGFQRRHDSEYLRACAHCATHAVRRAVFVAEDPWDADANTVKDPEQLRNVLRNSLCHEFDLLGWFWPESRVELSQVEPRADSGAFVAGMVHHPDGAPSTNFEIHFSKGHGQLVRLDAREFGYTRSSL